MEIKNSFLLPHRNKAAFRLGFSRPVLNPIGLSFFLGHHILNFFETDPYFLYTGLAV